jgi:hypothetical protein
MDSFIQRNAQKLEATSAYGTISWRAIFAGFFVSLLAYFALLSLGIAVGSGSLQSAAQGTGSAGGFGLGAGIWTAVSIFISIFAGSFAAGRIGGDLPIRVGRIQGMVIAALFFTFILSQLGTAIGLLGKGLGSTVSAVGGAAADISQHAEVQGLMDQALGNLNLKSPPEVVAKGVASRLVQGNGNSAKNYLAQQAGITPAQADARIEAFKPQVEQALRKAGAETAKVVKTVGWALFFSILLGTVGGSAGGTFGAAYNLRKPVSSADQKATSGNRAA